VKNFKKYILFFVILIGTLQIYKFVLNNYFGIPNDSDTHLYFKKQPFFESVRNMTFFEVEITGYHPYYDFDSISIPEKVLIGYNIYSVTGIKTVAFKNFNGKDTFNLVIPSSVTSIEWNAFENCRNLKSVVIPSSVKHIGVNAFKDCKKLSRVILEKGSDCFYSNPFVGCINLTDICVDPDDFNYFSVDGFLYHKLKREIITAPAYLKGSFEIPSAVSLIGEYAFSQCNGLNSIVIPSTVEQIKEYAFSQCNGLNSIVIPSTVRYIENDAFSGCTELKSVEFQSGMKELSIGFNVFSGCTGLKNVRLPDRLNCVRGGMFSDCKGLEEILLPTTVEEIGDEAFKGCENLKKINLPDNLYRIHERAFQDCSSLNNIEIPRNVREIDWHAFDGCVNLNVVIDNSEKYTSYSVKNGLSDCKSVKYKDDVFAPDSYDETKVYESSETPLHFSIISKTSVEVIYDKSYSDLKDVVIPAKVKIEDRVYNVIKIASAAFYNCDDLRKVYIPSSVTYIGTSAFSKCPSLHVIINNSMLNITISDYGLGECRNVNYLK